MAFQRERKLRLSQTVAPFGVGAIFDVLGESLVATDTTKWRGGNILQAKRLATDLGVDHFESAPVVREGAPSGRTRGVPYSRFPRWLFCSKCRRMVFWKSKWEEVGQSPTCGVCGSNQQLAPMRFVLACRNGHLDDVPWQEWAHSRAKGHEQSGCESRDLRFRTGSGGTLASLFIVCHTCKASRNLAGILGPEAMKEINCECKGRQPWQPTDAQRVAECTEIPKVLQRRAGNVYFAHVKSAIEIPPESDYSDDEEVVDLVMSHIVFRAMSSGPADLVPNGAQIVARYAGTTEQHVLEILEQDRRDISGTSAVGSTEEGQIEVDEWRAFQAPDPDVDERSTFVARQVALSPNKDSGREAYDELADLVDAVVVVDKLREVRALTGFSRYEYGHTIIRPDLKLSSNQSWLPAIEVFGEGVFLSLKEGQLLAWERNSGVEAREKTLSARLSQSHWGQYLIGSSPRFVLLHTLAHLLIRQLAFDCGYSAASLMERIYCGGSQHGVSMAGILIYTAAGDSEGTLGGLARQGEPPRLVETLLRALLAASWCSQDPICRESNGQGSDSLNLAACHACTLVGETSCTHGNLLLDRGLVIGGEGVPGYFERVITLAQQLVHED